MKAVSVSDPLLMRAQESLTTLGQICDELNKFGIQCEFPQGRAMHAVGNFTFACRVRFSKGDKAVEDDFTVQPSKNPPFPEILGMRVAFFHSIGNVTTEIVRRLS